MKEVNKTGMDYLTEANGNFAYEDLVQVYGDNVGMSSYFFSKAHANAISTAGLFPLAIFCMIFGQRT